MLELSITLIIFLFPLAYSPGPGNMFFAANGARFGFKSTLKASVGYHIATWIVTAGIGLGFGTIIQSIPLFFIIIKYAGSAYVLYLAWILFNAKPISKEMEAEPIGFWNGVILLLLNPKAYVIIVILSSQFLSEQSPNHSLLVLYITTIFTLNNFIAFSIWTILGDALMKLFKTQRRSVLMNRFFGIILATVAIWMTMT